MRVPSYFLGNVKTLLKVEVDLLFFGFGPKTQPRGHAVVLNRALLSLRLVKFECLGQSVEVVSIRWQEVSLGLIGILQVHQVDRLNP